MEDSKNSDLTFQEYLIIFFDLIGQREALRKITGIPVLENEKGSRGTLFNNLIECCQQEWRIGAEVESYSLEE